MKKFNLKDLKKLKSSIAYSLDVLNNVKVYSDIMDSYFSNEDNKIQHPYCYQQYKNFSENLKELAIERGLY